MNGELILKIDEASLAGLPAQIAFNYDDLKRQLGTLLEKYEGVYIPEDAIPQGKEDRATLGRFISALEEARREVKRRCLAPYAEFESRVKELVAMVEAPRAAIDAQLKAHEDNRREARNALIGAFYKDHIGDLAGLVPLERLFDEKWLNKTCRENEWQASLLTQIKDVRQGLDSIGMVAPPAMRQEAESKYLETLSLPETFSWLQERKEQAIRLAQREVEAAKAREEEERRLRNADNPCLRNNLEEPTPAPEPQAPAPETPPIVTTAAEMPDQEMTFTLTFTGRRSALHAMRRFMDANGIRYRKLGVGDTVTDGRETEARPAMPPPSPATSPAAPAPVPAVTEAPETPEAPMHDLPLFWDETAAMTAAEGGAA